MSRLPSFLFFRTGRWRSKYGFEPDEHRLGAGSVCAEIRSAAGRIAEI